MKIKEEIFKKTYEGELSSFPYGHLPKNLRDDDDVVFHVEEAYYSENNSHDGYTYLMVIRERDETPEEERKRIQDAEDMKSASYERDYKTYLKFKARFETRDELLDHLRGRVNHIKDIDALWAEAKDYYANKGKEMGGSYASFGTTITVVLNYDDDKERAFNDKNIRFQIGLDDLKI